MRLIAALAYFASVKLDKACICASLFSSFTSYAVNIHVMFINMDFSINVMIIMQCLTKQLLSCQQIVSFLLTQL